MAGLTTTIEKQRFRKWLTACVYSLGGKIASDDIIHDDLCTSLAPTEFFALVRHSVKHRRSSFRSKAKIASLWRYKS